MEIHTIDFQNERLTESLTLRYNPFETMADIKIY